MNGHRASRRAGLCLVVLLGIWGCDDDVSDGDGGGGAGGDPCDADPTCCPQAFPVHGAICNKTVSCPYSLGAGCSTPIAVEATCVGGQWDALRPASCVPLDAGASCDPVGTWQVDYQGGTAPAQPLMASGFELEIATNADGILLMSARGTIDSTDGCTIMAQWSEADCGGTGNATWCIDIQDQLDLTVSGDQATGTYTTQCTGECDWHETCAATATRTSS